MEKIENYTDFLVYLEVDGELASVVPAMLAEPDKFYRSFSIKKKRGGFRVISSPYPSLALIQNKIFRNVLSAIDVHENSFAYRKKLNAIQHASIHVENDELLLLDIKDFFPSISRQMIFQSLEKHKISEKICYLISILCTLNGCLPQGACTSPLLSNIIFKSLDHRFQRLAESLDLVYSRYADDLAFSGKRIPRHLPKIVQEILQTKDFNLNPSKTRLKILGAKKIITGISISSGVLKAPKSFKRSLRAQIYELEKCSDDLSRLPILDPMIYERVLGKINYLLQIEPANKYALEKKICLSQRHQDFLGLNRDGIF